ncbi:hypothetical protein JZ751_001384 [Albula glossodonta]|uniref:Uncharacterized protein n=1 Tax=Albula glossodonta TaxID=121402 RepID=A0A8T2PTN2_9TELE|nr:hypothetical protein JZ751_001384 [Albula glossodonta]
MCILQAAEVERQLSTQVNSLRDDFREKSVSTSQHMSRLESLQAEIKMLSERKRELERRVNSIIEENEFLQTTVDQLQERTLVLERQCHDKDLQVMTPPPEPARATGGSCLPPTAECTSGGAERREGPAGPGPTFCQPAV